MSQSAIKAATKKALAWFRRPELVTAPEVLKGYTAPEAVVEIGEILAIEYRSDKFDGVSRDYRHDVTKHRRLFLSPDGGTIVVWPPFRVTTRGIEG